MAAARTGPRATESPFRTLLGGGLMKAGSDTRGWPLGPPRPRGGCVAGPLTPPQSGWFIRGVRLLGMTHFWTANSEEGSQQASDWHSEGGGHRVKILFYFSGLRLLHFTWVFLCLKLMLLQSLKILLMFLEVEQLFRSIKKWIMSQRGNT